MKSPWMNISVLALSMSAVTTTLYAEEQKSTEVQTEQTAQVDQATDAVKDESNVKAGDSQATQAANALQKQKVMRLKKQIYKKYLHLTNVNIH